jgi:hypothetical protein
MSCCAIEPCLHSACQVCSVSERFRIVPCQTQTKDGPCKLIANHPGPCRSEQKERQK